MNSIWDNTADAITRGDNLREVFPVKEYEDQAGYKHYCFTKQIFKNPKYTIPDDLFNLFLKFLNGGSREYPSDGTIPVDIAAAEAKIILKRIKEIAADPSHKFHLNAQNLLVKNHNDVNRLVRGTILLYLGEYTTRDWRRKRSTDDIDFWIMDQSLFEYLVAETGWIKNRETKEWEKKVSWIEPWKGILKSNILIASNDVNQGLDFGSGSYLEGASLKDNIKKKLTRGHDVDLSDVINIAIVNNLPDTSEEDSPWAAIKESCNMRHSRVTSNIISLCRYAHGIADYLKNVGESIQIFKDRLWDPLFIPNDEILMICRVSSHWLKGENISGPDATRRRVYGNLVVQQQKKILHSINLHYFAHRVLNLLNQKYEGIIFEILE
ncbi:MAG: hypothetical protein LUQ65_03140 [Candidatus Helarchaeota archaeon]|nr:hypothetical protein [Candidatus Helarchaeota archaeon]